MNLFDIMRAAGGGNAFAALAPKYGLSEDQMAKAVEAFMPAFSSGLKRSTSDPLGLMQFMQKLSGADYLRAFQNPLWAGSEGRGRGDEALNFLFGSRDVAQGVAKQASALTGIATEKLAEMLPTLASMTFGGLAQQAATANPAARRHAEGLPRRAGAQGGEGSARSLRRGAGAAREGSRSRHPRRRPS